MNNYVSDMLIRIKNGQQAQLDAVLLHPNMPKFCYKILEILYEEGFIRGFTKKTNEKNKLEIKVLLKYTNTGTSVISNVYSISTPGRRVYASINSLWKMKNGKGIFIVSTSKGILVDRDARFLNLGGEVLCAIE
jgi:small subunit ribosomal protein S8